MTDAQLSTVPQLLEEAGKGFLALSLQPDDYFDVLRGTVRYGSATDMQTILVSSSLAEHTLLCTMDKLEEPMGHVRVIDCISDMVMSPKSGTSRYVESPRLLEMILLELERALRSVDGESLIVIDSINSLMMHNRRDRTMAFLEALYNRVNLGGHTLVLLHLAQEEEEVSIPNLRTISDRVLVTE